MRVARLARGIAGWASNTRKKRAHNVAFDDHPSELQYSDRIQTVTVESVDKFLAARNEGWESVEVRVNK